MSMLLGRKEARRGSAGPYARSALGTLRSCKRGRFRALRTGYVTSFIVKNPRLHLRAALISSERALLTGPAGLSSTLSCSRPVVACCSPVALAQLTVRRLHLHSRSHPWPAHADASTVASPVTRQQTALTPNHPATAAEKAATYPRTALRPRPSRRAATSAGRRSIWHVNVPRTPTPTVGTLAVTAAAPRRPPSATGAVMLVTSPVTAPRAPAQVADADAAAATSTRSATIRHASPAVASAI
ncbi:hypothetical protein PUNSTDRAFT_121259 [Punctularia strigosozonata HHB-11173 SS5]|uniref:uncharacterized protein n=1 Tax=Punctularia strigosozonata (strain HHB-11173) TaxID=741275 RepID=UPI0004417524|nr:uncharacterized protein PUNSTDRAFT_121259 [Punctularia strigosozonata HHB-11173 SS5]EIN07025.1 hypothetical protein PUNSTDRAFT_121259 [Punctularia strigosozonata HHB-11173 SS5]